MAQYPDITERINAIPIRNTTAETIPPGGIVEVYGEADENGIVPVGKPTANNKAACMIAGPQGCLGTGSVDGDPVGWATYDTPFLAAYNTEDGTPVVNEYWGVKKGSWYLHKNFGGFIVQGGADELDGRVGVYRYDYIEEEDYPGYGYGSYDDGDGGATWSHDSTLNIGCDTGTGNIIGDEVRYTTVLFVRRGRPFVSISLEVIEEDKIIVQTECIEIIDPATVDLYCDGSTPVLDFNTVLRRVISCGVCA